MPHGIIIFGLNGSGKTTLGRELARLLNFKYIDHEDYAFEKSEIPYTNPRSSEETAALMLADIEKCRGFVLSAVKGNFGSEIESLYSLAVYITVPTDLRIERVKQREHERHGKRIREGGDMYEQNIKFMDFIASRSLSGIEEWMKTLACPVISIDGTKDLQENVDMILKEMEEGA